MYKLYICGADSRLLSVSQFFYVKSDFLARHMHKYIGGT